MPKVRLENLHEEILAKLNAQQSIVDFYLDSVNLNFTSQYYLCYYRDGALKNASNITLSPYSYYAKNVSARIYFYSF